MSVLNHSAVRLNGKEEDLNQYLGQVVLIVNTASKCGFTPQYEGLESVFKQYEEKGLAILGFPCNQFGKQEQGDGEQITEFCQLNYGVSFPMFDKIEVNGDGTHALYQDLKSGAPGLMGSKAIKWNFTKFLVNRQGEVVKRYAPTTKPEDMVADIEKLLAAS